MKAKTMLKTLENMREDAIICFGAGPRFCAVLSGR